ncbi:MAG: hypothetical protein HRT35_09730 [Algicola sp.]|nr:hypothetical protein [Algicola sp.]
MKTLLICLILLSFPTLATQEKNQCPPFNGLELLSKHKLVMLGEWHGTQEIPKIFGDLVCHTLSSISPATTSKKGSGKIAVMLEIQQELQPSLDLYMIDKISQQKFLSHPVWSPKWQDGRFSMAMLALIDRLKSLRQQYPGQLDVWLIDALRTNQRGASKDTVMAENAVSHKVGDYQKSLFLVGNYHNKINLKQGSSLAIKLKQFKPFTLTVKAQVGSYWACKGPSAQSCKANHFDRNEVAKTEGVFIYEDKQQYHGEYQFNRFTFSPPANGLTK